MDYKYIEQLLERYWNCETSLEEEQILRSFFRQKEVPAHLLRYKQLFAYQDVEKEKGLGDDFDTRILTRIERPVVKAQRLTMRTRFMPLFKAAAMIAVLFLMGTVMQHTMEGLPYICFAEPISDTSKSKRYIHSLKNICSHGSPTYLLIRHSTIG